MSFWNNKVKRILKAELLKKGISNTELALLLQQEGIKETKSSIDSKISRGTFSTVFFIQCLSVIGCSKIELDGYTNSYLVAAEPVVKYEKEAS